MSNSTLEGLAGRDPSPPFWSTVWLVRMGLSELLDARVEVFHRLALVPFVSDAKRRCRGSPRAQRGVESSLNSSVLVDSAIALTPGLSLQTPRCERHRTATVEACARVWSCGTGNDHFYPGVSGKHQAKGG